MSRLLKLRYILFVAFLFVSSVPVLVLGFWVQKSALDREISAVYARHLLLARNLTGALTRYAEDLTAVLLEVAVEIEEKRLDRESINLLENMSIQALGLLNEQARLTEMLFGSAEQLPEYPAEALANAVSVDKVIAGGVVFSPVMANAAGAPAIYIVKGFSNGGFIVAALAPDYFVEIQKSVSFGNSGHVAIVDQTGRVLAHPSDDWRLEMRDISKLPPVAQMISGKTGVSRFYSPAVKADMIAGYAAAPKVGWGVMIPQPFAELEQRASVVRTAATAISLGGMALAALIGWWLAGYISRPVRRVAAIAEEMSRGAHHIRAKSPGPGVADELRELTNSFNHMADAVDRTHEDLERRVDERTRELSEEIAVRKAAEEKIRHMAGHDPLTRLPNRTLLMDRLSNALTRARRGNDLVAVLFIDLDHFKPVNDTHGHHVGDRVLIEVGQRLTKCVRESDTVGRYGGDEFIVILTSAGDAAAVEEVSGKLDAALRTPFEVDGAEVQISGTIGVALAVHGDGEPEALLKAADQAMYQSKGDSRSRSVC